MNRIETDTTASFSKEDLGINWKSILISAHVESNDGPNMHILRSKVKDGGTYQVEAEDGIDDEQSGASIFVIDEEIILKTCCPDAIDSDATVLMTFDLSKSVLVEAMTIDSETDPPIVIRNLDDDTIVMMTTGDDPMLLHAGPWNLQATAVLDGRERTTLIRLNEHVG